MELFWYCLNGIGPTVLCVVVGYLLKRVRILPSEAVPFISKLCFSALLPIMLFNNIASIDFRSEFDISLIIYAVCATLVITAVLCLIVPLLSHERSRQSALIHCLFRGNFLQLGYIIGARLFGEQGTAYVSMLIAFIIPLLNLLGVVVLTWFMPGNNKLHFGKLLLNIIKNPLIIASVLGFLVSWMPWKLPVVLTDTSQMIGGIASVLCLLMLGAQFDFKGLRGNLKTASLAVVCKLILIPAVTIAIAIWLGFRGAKLGALFSLFCAPSAMTAYMMARGMHSDEELCGQIVLLSTACSAVTMFAWSYLLKSFGFM